MPEPHARSPHIAERSWGLRLLHLSHRPEGWCGKQSLMDSSSETTWISVGFFDKHRPHFQVRSLPSWFWFTPLLWLPASGSFLDPDAPLSHDFLWFTILSVWWQRVQLKSVVLSLLFYYSSPFKCLVIKKNDLHSIPDTHTFQVREELC